MTLPTRQIALHCANKVMKPLCLLAQSFFFFVFFEENKPEQFVSSEFGSVTQALLPQILI